MNPVLQKIVPIATALAVAIVVVSCKGKLAEAERINLAEAPVQVVTNMFVVDTKNGIVTMRMEGGKLEKYENDTLSTDYFPEGFEVYGYTEEGLLETVIVADRARHTLSKRNKDDELWAAFGNVVVHNVLNQQTMESDTMYWDQNTKEIYTDCYVKMYSPDGFMQGYGMRSDDRGRNAILHNPFNSYGIAAQDTTVVVIDSVNFIGPLLK